MAWMLLHPTILTSIARNCTSYLNFSISIFLIPLKVFSQGGYSTPISVKVDTGSHICTHLGQDYKEYETIYAGDNRYFINEQLSEISRFGAGNCVYNTDGVPPFEKKNFCVTDADGQRECFLRVVRVNVRAYADCTNDPRKIGSSVGTACLFTAISKRGDPQ